jgi:hypothetical protein
MPAIVTNKFRIHNAKQFVEAFDEVAATSGAAITDSSGLLQTHMYLFIGKVTAWTESSSDDTAPPTPTDSVANTVYNHWRDMIAAKKIGSTDVSHVCPRYNWTSGTNYFAYTHANNALFDQTFYVMTEDYNVYKCLSNNNTDGVSTVKPTGTGTSIVTTGDGYKWKFLYQVSAARALKFVTPSYMPTQRVRKANGAIANTSDSSFQYDIEIAANSTGNGAVEVAHVAAGGTGYKFETGVVQTGYSETTTTCKIVGTGLATGSVIGSDIYFTSQVGTSGVTGKGGTITAYDSGTDIVTWTPALASANVPADGDGYSIGPKVAITGDGQGANVRVTNTASGVIGDVVVVAGGNNYGNAIATVTANASYGSSGSITPVIGPRGGHGDDAVEELGGFFVMINSRLEYGESGNFTTNNDFRKIGLVAQPLYANGDVATASAADQCVTMTIQTWNSTAYAEDATLTGVRSGATGKIVDFKSNTTIRLVDVIMGSNTTAGYDGIVGSFQANETITAGLASSNTSAVVGGDFEKFSGDVLYVENRSPVTRADDQIEDVKLIIEF